MVLGVPIPTGVMHRNSKVLIGLDAYSRLLLFNHLDIARPATVS